MSDDAPSCPVTAHRKVLRPGETEEPGVARDGVVWRVGSAALTKEVLRQVGFSQAGFLSESVRNSKSALKRMPLLFMDGPEHRRHRLKLARFFTPRAVDERYRHVMESYADGMVDELRGAGTIVFDAYAMRYSVLVAGQVLGLTNSTPAGMAKRLSDFFHHPPYDQTRAQGGRSRFQTFQAFLSGALPTGAFLTLDVWPAVRARRRERQDDVISHLLDEGYTLNEILTECIMYGAAGMVTTREFISVCLWHFLTDPALRERFLAGDDDERSSILIEILRVEAIVGHLYRRAAEDADLEGPEGPLTIGAGDLVDMSVRQANIDPAVVGDDPLAICPGRPIAKGFRDEVMSFGDGAHRCPGNALALQETDILLTRLLRQDVMLVDEPRIDWDDTVAAYELREFRIRVS